MITMLRRLIRQGIAPASATVLAVLTLTLSPAFGQKPADPPQKEVTDGFFDVPARESEPSWGLPAYMLTGALGGAAIFVLCKSARRG